MLAQRSKLGLHSKPVAWTLAELLVMSKLLQVPLPVAGHLWAAVYRILR
jgi:hypothetical protein